MLEDIHLQAGWKAKCEVKKTVQDFYSDKLF